MGRSSRQSGPWGVVCDAAPLKVALLCRPEAYLWIPTNDIVRATLSREVHFDAKAAMAQHGELVSALEGAGVDCQFLEPDEFLPYQCFVRDMAVMGPRGLIVGQTRVPGRRGEIGPLLGEVCRRDLPVWHHATAGSLEGGDVHFLRQGLAVIGVSGDRTSAPGAEQLAVRLEDDGWEVYRLAFPPHFVHLNMLFQMLATEVAVLCQDVLDPAFAVWLERHGIEPVTIGYRDVMQVAGQVLCLGNGTVISAAQAGDFNARLRAFGFTVLAPDLEMFTLGGGGPVSLTLPLQRCKERKA